MAWGQYYQTQAHDITLFKTNFILPAHLQLVSLAAKTMSRACAEISLGLQAKGVFCSHKSQCQSPQSTPKEQMM